MTCCTTVALQSGSVRYAQSQILAFARDLIGQFSLGASLAQVGLVEFDHDASVLIGLSSSLSSLEAAISVASAAGGVGLFGTYGDTARVKLARGRWHRVVVRIRGGRFLLLFKARLLRARHVLS